MLTNTTERFIRLLVLLLAFSLAAGQMAGCGLFVRETDNGDNGENGDNGSNGSNGSNGENGSNGSNGENGSNGGNGDALTVYDIRDPARRAQLDSFSGLTVEGVIVTAVRAYSHEGTDRYDIFVQEPGGGAYSAIMLWSSAVPADPGEVLTVTGDYDSYFDMDQLRAVTFQTTGTAPVPGPELFQDPSELATGGSASYSHQSVLVQVRDISVTEPRFLGSDDRWHGDFQIDGGLIVGPLFRHDYRDPTEDDEFTSLTGVLNYSFSNSRLQPRKNEDMVFIDGTIPGEPGEPGEPSDTTIAEVRMNQPSGPVTVEGTVTARRSRGSRFDLWIQSENAGPWDGIMVHNANTDAEPGDRIEITGSYDDYWGMDQLTDVASVTVISSGQVPEPLVVTPGTIATGSEDAFSYQGLLVRVDDVTVTEFPVQNDDAVWDGDFKVTGGLVIGTYFWHDYDNPAVGDQFQSITGVLRYSFNQYRLEPRSNADMVFSDGTSPSGD